MAAQAIGRATVQGSQDLVRAAALGACVFMVVRLANRDQQVCDAGGVVIIVDIGYVLRSAVADCSPCSALETSAD